MRAFKTVNDGYIEPISFIVPRRAEVFQGDIYPPATSSTPGVSAAEWFDGKTAFPPKIDLQSVFDGQEPVSVPATPRTPNLGFASQAPPSPVKPEPESVPEPAPASAPAATQARAPPTMAEQKTSMSNMASKFADHDEDEEEEEVDPGFEHKPKALAGVLPLMPDESKQVNAEAVVERVS